MSLITKKFATELNEKEMRDAYLSAQTRTYVAYQIRTIRAQRGWSQEQLAEKLHTSQSAVSRMEDRQYGKQNLHTLLELAGAFNCGLVVRFVRYADFIKDTDNLSPDNLWVPEFSPDSLIPLAKDDAGVAQLDDQTRAAVEEGLAQAQSGKFVPNASVTETNKRRGI